jgi:AcrR family transcriptional regulator
VAASAPQLPPNGPLTPTRERVLLVALSCFASRGFHGTSVRDLAKELDIQPGSLYSHVPSKEHLLATLVELGHRTHVQHVEAAVGSAGADPVARLAAFMNAHVEVHARWSMLAVVSNNDLASLPPAMAQPSLLLRQRVTRLLVEIVEQGRDEGRFDVPDVALVVAALGAMGMRVAAWFDGDPQHDVAAVAETYAELALRMVGAGSATPQTRRPRPRT